MKKQVHEPKGTSEIVNRLKNFEVKHRCSIAVYK